MPSSPASAPISMTISTLGPASSISIYTLSSETFIEDLNAYVTMDIV
jgi:hypothetical protein